MSPRILIIEDSETQLKYLRDKLETKGFEVVAASDGIEGYQKVYETAPDLIIADVVMPNINGYQLCRMLKNSEDTQKIPIILLTILDKKIDKFWGKKSGAQLFLSKSIDFEELYNHITSVIKRYPINQEYKDHLQHQIVTRDSAQTHLNNVLNELLMKTIFSNEFRNLSDFLNYEKVMVEKIFSLLSSFMEYNIAGLFFTSPDTLGENILYLDTLGRNVSKRVLSDIHYDFFKKLAEHKEIKSPKFEIVRVLFGKEVEYEYSDFASKIVIPLIYDKKLIGGLCFYTKEDVNYSSFKFFDIMITELLTIFKMKYQYSEKELMSVLDGLTGLYNRRQLELNLEQEFNRTKRHPANFSLAILDIDYFKKVNDTYGHQYGDYVLKAVADILKNSFRKTDLLYRYGGEELVIIMPETYVDNALIPIQRLRQAIEDFEFDYNGIKTHQTVSIGLSMNYQEFETHTAILKSADEALYRAKESGRNRVIVYEQ